MKNLQSSLYKYGYNINVDGYYGTKTSEVVEAFNRHFSPEIFIKEEMKHPDTIQNPSNQIKEKMKHPGTIQNPLNQRWYKISEERLDKLLEI